MTSKETAPDYGVRTCGKLAEEPFQFLGPCLRDPGHDGRCRFRAPLLENGTIEVTKVENPLETDETIVKYRKYIRNSARISMVCCFIVAATAIYSLLNAFGVFG